MELLDELKCCELVLIHLEDDTHWNSIDNFKEHPPFKEMVDYLGKFCYDMIGFTKYLNEKYNIQEKPLWVNTAKEFYATTKSRIFYKTIIRNHKLELCLN